MLVVILSFTAPLFTLSRRPMLQLDLWVYLDQQANIIMRFRRHFRLIRCRGIRRSLDREIFATGLRLAGLALLQFLEVPRRFRLSWGCAVPHSLLPPPLTLPLHLDDHLRSAHLSCRLMGYHPCYGHRWLGLCLDLPWRLSDEMWQRLWLMKKEGKTRDLAFDREYKAIKMVRDFKRPTVSWIRLTFFYLIIFLLLWGCSTHLRYLYCKDWY